MSKKGEEPARMGRPVTVGATAFVGAKFPPAMVEGIDKWATAVGVGRSEAMRRLVELGLKVVRRATK
jgi:hypothetical protein